MTSGNVLHAVNSGNLQIQNGTLAFGAREGVLMTTGRGMNLTNTLSLSGSAGATFYGAPSSSAGTLASNNTGLGGTLYFVGGSNISSTTPATFFNINNNSLLNHAVHLGPNSQITVGASGAVTSKVSTLSGGTENSPGLFRVSDGVGATIANIDTLIIGSGTGTAGRVTLDGGTVAPGNANSATDRWNRIGTLSVVAPASGTTGLDLKSGTLSVDLAQAGVADLITVAGSVTRVGTSALNLVLDDVGSPTISDGDKWRILTTGSSMDPALAFTSIDSSAIAGGWVFNAYVGDSSTGSMGGDNPAIWVVATVPEPTVLGGMGVVLSALRRRRRVR